MNTTLLTYLTEFAVHGSSQKAAEYLGISRTSITRGIKRLEDELGTQLFIMTPDGAVPTYAGEICLRYARQILKINCDLCFDLATDGHQNCTVNIGMDINRTQRMLPEALPTFHRKYPNIQVHLHELRRAEEYETALIDRLLDFAIVKYPIHSPRISFEPLMTEEYVLVAPKDDPFTEKCSYEKNGKSYIALEQYKDKPFILGRSDQKSRTICDKIFEKAGFRPKVIFQTRSHLNGAMLAWNGFAYTLVPESYTVINCKVEVKYYHLEEGLDAKWVIGLATLKGERLSHAAEQLKNEIFSTFQKERQI